MSKSLNERPNDDKDHIKYPSSATLVDPSRKNKSIKKSKLYKYLRMLRKRDKKINNISIPDDEISYSELSGITSSIHSTTLPSLTTDTAYESYSQNIDFNDISLHSNTKQIDENSTIIVPNRHGDSTINYDRQDYSIDNNLNTTDNNKTIDEKDEYKIGEGGSILSIDPTIISSNYNFLNNSSVPNSYYTTISEKSDTSIPTAYDYNSIDIINLNIKFVDDSTQVIVHIDITTPKDKDKNEVSYNIKPIQQVPDNIKILNQILQAIQDQNTTVCKNNTIIIVLLIFVLFIIIITNSITSPSI